MTDTAAKWDLVLNPLDTDTQKVQIKDNGHYLGFDEVLGLLAQRTAFRDFFANALRAMPYEAFNMEWPPIDVENIGMPFEMVVYKAPFLLLAPASSSAFDEHFEENELTAVFLNHQGDAILLAPKPVGAMSGYGHLASFLAKAPAESVDDLLMALGEVALENVSEKPLWLSTSGGGVPWLHIRLDDKPKYYRWAAYTKGG